MPNAAPISLTKRQRDLVEENIPLAYHFADRLMPYASAKGILRDDLRQEALVLMMRAVPRFNPYFGYRFSSYIGKHIQLGLLTYIKRHCSVLRAIRGDKNPPTLIWADKPGGESEDAGSVWSMLGIEEDPTRSYVRDFLEHSGMTYREREILAGRIQGLCQQEIADRNGCSQPVVSRGQKRIRDLWLEYDRADQCTTTERPSEDNAVPSQRLPMDHITATIEEARSAF